MATRRAVANGNWSATGTWNGGVVPGNGDTVYANGFNVTLDTDVLIGGANNPIVNAGSFVSGQWYEVDFVGTTSWIGIGAASNTAGTIFLATGVGSGTGTAKAIATLTTAANTSAGAAAGGSFVMSTVRAINTNLRAGTTTCLNVTATSGTLTLSGLRVVGGSVVGAVGVNTTASTDLASCTFTGGTGVSANALTNASTGTVNVSASCTFTAGGAATSPALSNTTSGSVTVTNSTFTASSFGNAVSITSTISDNRLSGDFLDHWSGWKAISGGKWRLGTPPTLGQTRYALAGTTDSYFTMYGADNGAFGNPIAANVRSGIVYGGGNLTGTCAVPAAGSVALGVPVDAAFGTAVLTPEAVWGHASRTITEGGITAADVWSASSRTLTTSSGPTAVEIRQEMDANSTKLANLDASISSRLADADYVAPTSAPTVADIRAELAVELARLDASVSSRLAGSSYTAPTTPPTAAEITTAVWAAADKTGYSLTSAERTAIAAAVEGSLLNEADGQAVLNAIVGAIGNTNLSEVSLVAAVRADLERNGGKLDNIPTSSAPSASAVAGAVRTELGVELGRLDASVSSRLAPSGTLATVTNLTNAPASVTPSDIWSHSSRTLTSASGPTAAEIRQEIDANSTKLDAAISSRMAASEATKLDAVKAKTDALNTDRLANVATTNIVGTLLAQANS